jgi:hypothetical protein
MFDRCLGGERKGVVFGGRGRGYLTQADGLASVISFSSDDPFFTRYAFLSDGVRMKFPLCVLLLP